MAVRSCGAGSRHRRYRASFSVVNRDCFGEYQPVLLVIKKVCQVLSRPEAYRESEQHCFDRTSQRECFLGFPPAPRQNLGARGFGYHESSVADAQLIAYFNGGGSTHAPIVYERAVCRTKVCNCVAIFSDNYGRVADGWRRITNWLSSPLPMNASDVRTRNSRGSPAVNQRKSGISARCRLYFSTTRSERSNLSIMRFCLDASPPTMGGDLKTPPVS